MAIYFVSDFGRTIQTELRCLYCERLFKAKQELNDHYLAAHEDAFTEEELNMARAQRANLEQKLRR